MTSRQISTNMTDDKTTDARSHVDRTWMHGCWGRCTKYSVSVILLQPQSSYPDISELQSLHQLSYIILWLKCPLLINTESFAFPDVQTFNSIQSQSMLPWMFTYLVFLNFWLVSRHCILQTVFCEAHN